MEYVRKIKKNRVVVFLGFLVAACVTVHVNFPEGAVQKATDDYVKELYKAKSKSEGQSNSDQGSFVFPFEFISSSMAQTTIEEFKVKSAKAMDIQARQKNRLSEIDKYKVKGFLGETEDGMLVLRNAESLKGLMKKKVMQLLNEENMDRQELYTEVADSNSLAPAQGGTLKKSFARSFQAASPRGTWIQTGGSWKQK